MSANEYCRHFRSMDDAMADLGEPITDRTLVLALLRGLNEMYNNLQTILPLYQRRFPTFLEAHALSCFLRKSTEGQHTTRTALPSLPPPTTVPVELGLSSLLHPAPPTPPPGTLAGTVTITAITAMGVAMAAAAMVALLRPPNKVAAASKPPTQANRLRESGNQSQHQVMPQHTPYNPCAGTIQI